jgi:uncharacterized protein (TIGR03032 family)
MTEAEQTGGAASAPEVAEPRLSISPGFRQWLLDQQVSLAFTSYQTGRLLLAGVDPQGRLAFNKQNYFRAMGLHYADGTLHLAGAFQIWRLENLLNPGEFADGAYDCMLVPRAAHTTGYIDAHDLAIDGTGRTIVVNTRYSCLATLDERFSFRPVWKPPFITALYPEDRCHLNGLAMEGGVPRFVTSVNTTDVENGWRELPRDGGVVIDVDSSEIVTSGLSMPHSPRIHDGALWVQDSGRGFLLRIDRQSGKAEPIAFCPGFLRGMAMHGRFAVAALSQARHGSFKELPLQEELDRRGIQPWCGIVIIDLEQGAVVEHLRIDGGFTELFDLAVLPGVRNPMSIGIQSDEIVRTVRFNPDFAPLAP